MIRGVGSIQAGPSPASCQCVVINFAEESSNFRFLSSRALNSGDKRLGYRAQREAVTELLCEASSQRGLPEKGVFGVATSKLVVGRRWSEPFCASWEL